MKRNFVATVIEPANDKAPLGVGVGVELQFNEEIEGFSRDTLLMFLADDATMDDAESLARLLNSSVVKVKASNP
ncbi:hypothetical protein [Duganella phyllosphaerae]|uniref:hypothetical protein n=1 Tax=Duganella phyllosphaerae TaxID=762836 RepID=UPI0008737C9A|nr:hypothetical protein [Duganella phyllosphaerae]